MNEKKDTLSQDESITNNKELNAFLLRVKDRLTDKSIAPVHALATMKWVLAQSDIYKLLTPDNKELARDIWLRIRQSGFQVDNPPLLFSADEADLVNNAG